MLPALPDISWIAVKALSNLTWGTSTKSLLKRPDAPQAVTHL